MYNVVEKLLYGSEKDMMAEEDTVLQAKSIINVLKQNGHSVYEMEVYDDFADEILQWKDKIDVIFNLTEGVGNDILKAPYVPFILESLQIPFTGNNWEALLLTMNKVATKEILSAHGILTPEYAVFDSVPTNAPKHLKFPMIVKPSLGEASYGIDKNAVVHSFNQLSERIAYVLEVYKMPALAEFFIDGMDISSGIIGNDDEDLFTFSPYAIIYKKLAEDEYPIQTFDSKFDTESDINKNTHIVYPAPLDDGTLEKIQDITVMAYKICKCSGYARADFRIDKNMNPYFLEMNANPDLDPKCGIATASRTLGIDYNALIDMILRFGYDKQYSDIDKLMKNVDKKL